ncbi:3-hydroxyanthranilic acid dioxygenase [Yamadazyma tenuis]|uniref:3-hydroxyanthranilate 3,4-dioxygenase n=1 Tax=Candida tenuis (strain ATCC 10573 / BCRC 21748 / CBS 615 / JCM 9827 / NBRC 10315 / NRRL Y-1498 / VKM Y-70) TaxID=590646 RepID=G3B8C6_CANTC|nr:3-hydroxyanthranilic acid dioxygenase [Yamadazyma tenuis ATCC 10573]EGV62364.1 3-hydroxyanthranilic acid dioxygenase [Yamadazyma tenuis ATCC 10573]WEJ93629.1 3-hydroxyanthranilic acid dioxygenase [Yamadazyma tenuis]
MLPQPLDLQKWIRENEDLLQPPVNNFLVHRGGFSIMIVGGPNARTDYHINQTPEYFYMFKGTMILKVVDDGEFKDIYIKEGESFLLPPNVPHNPTRFANTIGLVVEQDRPKDLLDKVRWYCRNCKEPIHELEFYCYDLGTQIKEAIINFDKDIDARTCEKCGTLNYSRPQE